MTSLNIYSLNLVSAHGHVQNSDTHIPREHCPTHSVTYHTVQNENRINTT